MQVACNSHSNKSNASDARCCRTETSRRTDEVGQLWLGPPTTKKPPMLHITYLMKTLCGFAAITSFGGFVFHAVTGNSDMALMCFVGIGGSAAMAWMFTAWRQA